MIVVHGETLWSPTPQLMDDDEEEERRDSGATIPALLKLQRAPRNNGRFLTIP